MIRKTGIKLGVNSLNKRIFIQVVNLRKMHKSQGAFNNKKAFMGFLGMFVYIRNGGRDSALSILMTKN